jgi:glycosyltransferase involved in cell wall biosynthesis
MQEEPLISVMIIAYNHGRFVRQAIEGALMQSCSYPFEIVVCDDCSTDNTREICLKLQKEYPEKIRLLFNEYNKGPIDNYFATMYQCRGKYIADCSADDYWIDPLKLQKQVDVLEQREDVVLVFSDWKVWDETRAAFLDRSRFPRARFEKKTMDITDMPAYMNRVGQTNVLNINTCCFRRETALNIYEKHTQFFDKNKHHCEDYQLFCFLLSQGVFYYIDEELGVYRSVVNSVSRSDDSSKNFIYQYKRTCLRLGLAALFKINIDKYLSIQSYWLVLWAFKAKNCRYAKQSKDLLQSYGYR